MKIILQPQRTLDDAVLGGVKTFRNGCNFRLLFHDNDVKIEFGCYGVHVNLSSGDERLLLDWYTDGDHKKKMEPRLLPISEETKKEMLKREPCKVCGAPLVKKQDGTQQNKRS